MSGDLPSSWLYRAFEEVDGVLEPRMVGAYARNRATGEFKVSASNDKKRIYTDLPTARAYRKRLAKEGRKVRIFKYQLVEEVE